MSDLCTKNQISGKILTSNLTVAVAVTEHVLHTIFSNFFENSRHVQCSPYNGATLNRNQDTPCVQSSPCHGVTLDKHKTKKNSVYINNKKKVNYIFGTSHTRRDSGTEIAPCGLNN